MIITWDTETRGLFGEIFAFGVYDGFEYKSITPDEFIPLLKSYGETVYAYAHNLDFDIAKLWKVISFEIDWDSSFVINHNMTKIKIKDTEIFLCDSFTLMPMSLDAISRDFNLSTPKMDLDKHILENGYTDKNDYFMNVSKDEPTLHEYLKYDCMALYEFLMKVIELSEFSQNDFTNCLTLPSIAMKIFKNNYSEDFEKITSPQMSKAVEDLSREAYFGGRVEVIKPELEGMGYHYDVNSLYPYCMKSNSYPAGIPYQTWTSKSTQGMFNKFLDGEIPHCIIKAVVEVPESLNIPPLPIRLNDKLIFPVGIFSGTWVGEELKMAMSYGVKVKEFIEGVYWKESANIFEKFINQMEYEKMNSTGARRSFFKNIQNSLYGKLGMNRLRDSYCSPKHEEKLKEKNIPYLKVNIGKHDLILTKKVMYAKYIKPYLSAYVTAFARIVLYQAINKYRESVYYYDTDSLVLDTPMEEKEVDSKQYGKWKLEYTITNACFLQPKFYGEIKTDGSEVLKSKGLIADFRKTMTYNSYVVIFNTIKNSNENDEILLYTNKPARRKLITSLINNIDPDKPVYLKKCIRIKENQKRITDYINNNTKPLKIYLH